MHFFEIMFLIFLKITLIITKFKPCLAFGLFYYSWLSFWWTPQRSPVILFMSNGLRDKSIFLRLCFFTICLPIQTKLDIWTPLLLSTVIYENGSGLSSPEWCVLICFSCVFFKIRRSVKIWSMVDWRTNQFVDEWFQSLTQYARQDSICNRVKA